ncbi:MAG: peroxiredoxin family protein [Aquificae bacterium]|nr:peroxiredoxin family protein [Aquificota bacterium]
MATVGIILLSNSVDKVLPSFMLANTSAAMGMEVGIFFSFNGIHTLHREKVKEIQAEVEKLKVDKMPSIDQLIKQAIDLGVKLFPCETAMRMFGYTAEDLLEGVEKPVGAATFLNFVNKSDKPIVMTF